MRRRGGHLIVAEEKGCPYGAITRGGFRLGIDEVVACSAVVAMERENGEGVKD